MRGGERSAVCNTANVPFCYRVGCLSESMEASLLYTTVAVVPIHPDVEKTRSENEACSISVRVCACVFEYMCLYIGFSVRVCVLDLCVLVC